MRRKDREMSAAFGWHVIEKAAYGVVSMVDDKGLPYSLPVSMIADQDKLYFHSAKEGTKNILIGDTQAGKPVQVVFVTDVEVPALYSNEELKTFIADGTIDKYTSKVFTTEFASAIVSGRAVVVKEDEEKKHALRLICQKYTPSKMEFVEVSLAHSLARTEVFRIDVEDITAKRKKYDNNRQEMKWERME